MCYPKPGPRCSTHALAARKRAFQAADAAEQKFEQARKNGASDEEIYALSEDVSLKNAKLYAANEAYHTTTHNIKNLKESKKSLEERKSLGTLSETDEMRLDAVTAQLSAAQQDRQTQMRNLALSKAAKKQFAPYERSAQKLHEELDHDLEKTKTENDAAQAAADANHAEVVRLFNEVSDEYRSLGQPRIGSVVGLWGTGDGPHPAKLDEYRAVRAKQDELDAAAEATRGNHVRQLTYTMARKQQITDLSAEKRSTFDGPLHAGYGQTYVQPDGKTNTYYMATIPGTQQQIFARVNKIEEGNMYLETGEVIGARGQQPANFRFTKPADDAQRGISVFRMDSSG